MKSRKYQLQKRPVYEQTDKRESERHKNEEDMRRQARKTVEKMLGKNYFTNTQEHVLQDDIDIQERNKK